ASSGGAGGASSGGAAGAGGSSSGGGAAGAGGSSSSGGAAGAGGGGAAGAGGEGGAAGGGGEGGAPAGTVLLLAGGTGDFLAGAYQPGPGWTSAKLTGKTAHGVGVAVTGGGEGVGVARAEPGGALRYALWSAGKWASMADVGPSVTTRDAPSIVGSASAVHVVFHGDDYKHYYAERSGKWAPAAEPVKPPAKEQSFGPSPAAIALVGADVVIAYAGDDGKLYEQVRSAGAWKPAAATGAALASLKPGLCSLDKGPELLAVYVRSSDKKLAWLARTAGTWSQAKDVEANTYSGDPLALAALSGGRAVLTFRGLDGKIYASVYDPGKNPPWAQPAAVASPNPAIKSGPSLAPGTGGTDAELAFVDAGSQAAYHSRLAGGKWSAPALVGGSGLLHAAVASMP
ncbi:MAG: hypothetical protein HY744_08625, partial [Deltaproteobacteria bacterium]|nr:hypothetical protein [Deltaproteobacteria bacterium]